MIRCPAYSPFGGRERGAWRWMGRDPDAPGQIELMITLRGNRIPAPPRSPKGEGLARLSGAG
ncbi:hypothetical protein XaclCFBP3371_01015 [Xanthomonas euvesicatoria pv. citrumelonis]|nr:hypothetical protein XaclCFBP3371_01015 [Xanthomonas euvesicatoria pv. citrumelonis]TKA18897.1 hypothetical protein TN51_07270 [Xanthomonas euvesicatoria pv. citrumelonis]